MAQTVVNKSQAVNDKDGYAGYTFRLEVIMNSYNSTNATYNITINHYAKGDNATNHKYNGLTTPKSTITATANGTTIVSSTATVSQITGSEVNVHSWTGNIQANADGNLTVSYSANYNANKSSSYLPATHTISQSVAMPTIPRYATITSFNVNQRDETSLNVTWGANVTCDKVWYRIRQSGGSFGNYIEKSGTNFNITGLTANTTYVVQLRVRRKDSQLTTDSSEARNTTYDYPHVTSAPNFIVGNTNTITFYNPLKRSCAIYIINPLGTEKGGDTTTGTTISGYVNASWQSFFYNGIPNSTSGLYRVRLVCSAISRDTTVDGGTYSINVNDNKPDADGLTYQYTADLTNLTNNNQTVIDKLSTITFNITNGAIAKNGASITQYIVKWGNTVQDEIEDISQDSAVLENGSGNKLYVTVYDSRNLNVTKELTIDNFVPYTKPQNLTIALHRRNGIEAISYIDLEGLIYYDTFGEDGVTNNVATINYTVNNGSTQYSVSTTGIVYSSQSATNHTKKFKLDDVRIYANGTSTDFDTDKNYTITALITDTSGSTTAVTGTLLSSKFAEDWFQDDNLDYHFGVNGIADEDYTETVHGDINVTGDFYQNGVLFQGGGDALPIGSIFEYDGNTVPSGYEKVEGSIDITGQTTTILALVKSLASQGIDYARYICKTTNGSANITDKPTSNIAFALEVIRKRYASNSDYIYTVIYYPASDIMPYYTHLNQSSSSLTWKQVMNNTYSTSETDTGKVWIDGKKIYRKVVTTNNYTLSSSSSAIASGVTNVSTLIRLDVSMLFSDGSWFSQWHLTDKTLRSNGEIRLYADSTATFNKVICILEYTKTS